jgi:hypothetical protein
MKINLGKPISNVRKSVKLASFSERTAKLDAFKIEKHLSVAYKRYSYGRLL